MAVGYLHAPATTASERVRRTVALLGRRGYAVTPARLAELCLGGPISADGVRWAVAASSDLAIAEGLVVEREALDRAASIRLRALGHDAAAGAYLRMAIDFVRTLVACAPFVRSVSIAGSLASGGFRATDDVDLNLIVDDGHRHLAYVAVNVLGIVHALRFRGKPVDELTRRPLAPRLMTANLILERSQCRPLVRQDEDMAFELLVGEPVFGLDELREVVDGNPGLLEHFPQLAARPAPLLIEAPERRAPRALFPRLLDAPARLLGQSAWRYMQWTRRRSPQALARVAYVRATMRPYTLFDSN
ncbi:MAG TPA: hypothetical protein VFL27_08970 [Candidatus Dormibacteraeota bacterium]|nr:hypothetical protein [Candidatus Dormibacteraeota bacterium]